METQQSCCQVALPGVILSAASDEYSRTLWVSSCSGGRLGRGLRFEPSPPFDWQYPKIGNEKKWNSFFSVKDIHCWRVLTFLYSPMEWLTFCQNSSTYYYFLFSGVAVWFVFIFPRDLIPSNCAVFLLCRSFCIDCGDEKCFWGFVNCAGFRIRAGATVKARSHRAEITRPISTLPQIGVGNCLVTHLVLYSPIVTKCCQKSKLRRLMKKITKYALGVNRPSRCVVRGLVTTHQAQFSGVSLSHSDSSHFGTGKGP